MKKVVSLLLALIMASSLAACGAGKHFASRRPGIFYNTDLRLSAREFLRLDSGFGLRLETAERRKVQ